MLVGLNSIVKSQCATVRVLAGASVFVSSKLSSVNVHASTTSDGEMLRSNRISKYTEPQPAKEVEGWDEERLFHFLIPPNLWVLCSTGVMLVQGVR